MKFSTMDKSYNLKLRTEEVAPKIEAHPDGVATRTLNELSAKELSAALSRMRRNAARKTHRKCRTTATLFEVTADGEVMVATASVSNSHEDQFDAPRGRREAFEKVKAMVEAGGWSAASMRDMSVAFYNRFPNSRPKFERV